MKQRQRLESTKESPEVQAEGVADAPELPEFEHGGKIGLVLCLVTYGLLLQRDEFSQFLKYDLVLQTALFVLVACIPGFITGRISYVDVAWPWGLALIGALILYFGQGYFWRKLAVGAIYLFIGLRMGSGALMFLKQGRLNTEFPRYKYRHLIWKKANVRFVALETQIEIIKQLVANISFGIIPALALGFNKEERLHVVEYIGFAITIGAYLFESTADMQKLKFLKAMKKAQKVNQVCNVGLWSLCRHPNYFGEWMVWNGLLVASVPSMLSSAYSQPESVWWAMAIGLPSLSWAMYDFLVYQTGAVPAEYFSVQKRPDYKRFQETTNQFFPRLI